MRSVYARILLWSFGTLLLSLAAFVVVSRAVSFRTGGRGAMFSRLNAMALSDAVEAYESGGAARLRHRLERLNQFMLAKHYVTDAAGKDLVSGEDLSGLLAEAGSNFDEPQRHNGKMVIVSASADRRYRLVVVAPPPPANFRMELPYYLLILLAVGVLCWALAMSIASPLRDLSRAVERFGRGELSVRVRSRRRDEIGALSATFDTMAERIETLLTSERRLLQDISHELRSPLARLSFAAELARTSADREAAVAKMRKEIDRLTHLVTALLDMTRLEGDPAARSLEEVRLGDLLQDVIESCRNEAEARRCAVRFDSDGDVTVAGQPELLRSAIENILTNAIRYTPEGSCVEVTLTRSAQGSGAIRIRDHGPGVPEASLPKIFQPFFRVDAARDSATGGVGLGLAIARRAISLHHGTVTAANANPGLAVTIELPA
jgi:signal transduction histidine kinase